MPATAMSPLQQFDNAVRTCLEKVHEELSHHCARVIDDLHDEIDVLRARMETLEEFKKSRQRGDNTHEENGQSPRRERERERDPDESYIFYCIAIFYYILL